MSSMQIQEVLQFAQDNDVKFVRLAFCDLSGRQKNVAVTVERLEQVLQEGLRFDAAPLMGEEEEALDLYLHPVIHTLHILPWRPQQGRVLRFFCEIRHAGGAPYAGDLRLLLRRSVEELRSRGLACEIGTKESFYLFFLDERGGPTQVPLDTGGYLDVAPWDRGENVRREACLMLEQMGIGTENSLHDQGPGQNAIALRHRDPLAAADDLVTFQSVAAMVATGHGLSASFAPVPLEGQAPNWLHVNLSLLEDGENLCARDTPRWRAFLSGVERHLSQVFSAAYAHLPGMRLAALPTLRMSGVHAGAQAHLRIAFPSAQVNPALLFALLLRAGISGLDEAKAAPSGARDWTPEAFLRGGMGENLWRRLQKPVLETLE